ncbi:MAG: LytTR family DNA-binding domain-containing protein [Woeseiaceae bacterium]|nr:LytTR family DNA-binding domain-containing protein [Woeseiaceae bacterium]
MVLVSALGLVPFAVTEALLELSLPFRPEFLDDELWAYSPALAFLGEFVTLASIVMPIHLLLWLIIDRRVPQTSDGNEAAPPSTPEFLQRVSNLQAEDVLALQAEEHYVRIYSTGGSELVHYRFGDAAQQMPAELGLQVHRSWWVAGNAIRSAKRGSRRWQLDLVNDVAVPVSDSYVKAVRARGWLKRKPRNST